MAGLGLLAALLLVIWAVPTVIVSRSPAYAAAKARAEADPTLRDFLGEPLEAAALPTRYRLTGDDGGEFRFLLTGQYGWARVRSVVQDGEVVHQEALYGLGDP